MCSFSELGAHSGGPSLKLVCVCHVLCTNSLKSHVTFLRKLGITDGDFPFPDASTSAGTEVQEVEMDWVVGANVLSDWVWGMQWMPAHTPAPVPSVTSYRTLLKDRGGPGSVVTPRHLCLLRSGSDCLFSETC